MSAPPDRFVTAATFRSAGAAHVARAHLSEHGIDAFVSDEGLGGMAPFHSDAGASVKLRVRAGEVDAARSLLDRPGASDSGASDSGAAEA